MKRMIKDMVLSGLLLTAMGTPIQIGAIGTTLPSFDLSEGQLLVISSISGVTSVVTGVLGTMCICAIKADQKKEVLPIGLSTLVLGLPTALLCGTSLLTGALAYITGSTAFKN